ncbi:chemotaxis protein CheB [Geodermatophilus sp. TF02-6]|uniref:chemotaxis protein CheB n=1 Tax=Geodermatophilus sp. TF02-6 TaxID=2250575 RepID=UPI001314E67C|nr:chemotaxis protein CheB [Geodermatophilus sp. TF02-6]
MVDRVVVVGASAGGIGPLQTLVAGLPEDLPAAVLVTVHLPATADSHLPRLLSRCGPLPAAHPVDGQLLSPASILVAPPDLHLTVRGERVRLYRGPRENRQRPAVDPMFRSAAAAFGPGVVAVVLSGALDDGSVGAAAVAAQDGVVVVQDPVEARVSAMPRAALAAVRRARRTPTAELAAVVTDLVRPPEAVPGATPHPASPERSPTMTGGPTALTDLGTPAALGCPECQGGMYESTPDGAVSYTCHVGHAWSAQSLLDAQHQAVEGAVYNAASKLMEIAAVHRRLAEVPDALEGREEHLRAAERAEQRALRVQQLATEDPTP